MCCFSRPAVVALRRASSTSLTAFFTRGSLLARASATCLISRSVLRLSLFSARAIARSDLAISAFSSLSAAFERRSASRNLEAASCLAALASAIASSYAALCPLSSARYAFLTSVPAARSAAFWAFSSALMKSRSAFLSSFLSSLSAPPATRSASRKSLSASLATSASAFAALDAALASSSRALSSAAFCSLCRIRSSCLRTRPSRAVSFFSAAFASLNSFSIAFFSALALMTDSRAVSISTCSSVFFLGLASLTFFLALEVLESISFLRLDSASDSTFSLSATLASMLSYCLVTLACCSALRGCPPWVAFFLARKSASVAPLARKYWRCRMSAEAREPVTFNAFSRRW